MSREPQAAGRFVEKGHDRFSWPGPIGWYQGLHENTILEVQELTGFAGIRTTLQSKPCYDQGRVYMSPSKRLCIRTFIDRCHDYFIPNSEWKTKDTNTIAERRSTLTNRIMVE